ncbi:MAG TPA: protein-disulfide reductase DsbD family protein [Bacteroidia bacterium]|nr:protein-disulfide reductase DsbD family protein [Bacteroidia bacterium]
MKRLLVLFIAFLPFVNFAQQQEPVSWSVSFEPLNGDEGRLIVHASIQPGWHIYSQRSSDAGPISTSFSFTPSADYERVGPVEEKGATEEFDKAFEAKLYLFHNSADFIQKIKLKKKNKARFGIRLEYTTCNEMMCLPPRITELTLTAP